MLHHTQSGRGFTLVEIMIVVAIIALLASIALPNYLRARKRAQATRILQDLRVIDGAVDQYAIERNKGPNTAVGWADIKDYLKTGSVLYSTGAPIVSGLGSYSSMSYTVDARISTPTSTSNALSDVAPAEFWSPYILR
jgi:prepilin-type N-terminal cleavage/methylation domain-containing protein